MSGTTAPLVLITRPKGQQEGFANRCTALGFTTCLLPCLEIKPLPVAQTQLSRQLENSRTILFTSANAVRLAHAILPLPWLSYHVHAIGAATLRSLTLLGQPVSLTPQSPFNSEAYLQQLEGTPASSLLIIKGKGGRGLIQPQLENRGWHVANLDVYERVRPSVSSDTINTLFSDSKPDIISITSDAILDNLWQLCTDHTPMLRTLPLVVNSLRCAERALQLGFVNKPLIAMPPGDEGQLTCLNYWQENVFGVVD